MLTGSAIVNEAMLTGESIPVMKTCLPMTNELYSETETTRHTLFGGTSVIQTRPVANSPVIGLVRSTGFLTTKGALVRDILYPKILRFAFYNDALKFVGIMSLIAVAGFLATLPSMIEANMGTVFIVDKSLNLITITVPPALPAAMTCGTLCAIARLKKYNIFCISPLRINVAGRIKTFVFDKTGTLTQEGLSVLGFRTCNNNEFTSFCSETSALQLGVKRLLTSPDSNNRNQISTLFLESLASCHAITYVHGNLVGDPLDVNMF